jgi:hypothetical protein
MKNNCLFTIVFLLFMQYSFAQTNTLQVLGTSPNLYLNHTVHAKENWYSIGRLYNVNPKELAPFNAMAMEKPLSVGTLLKIPLTAANFSQDGKKESDESFVPVYHTVLEKEWMYRISVNYNKVAIENLEKWNNITRNQVKGGLNLVVGYLKVKPGQSALAGKSPVTNAVAAAPAVVNTVSKAADKPEEKKQLVVKDEKLTPQVTEKPVPPIEKPTPVVAKQNTAKEEVRNIPGPVHTGTIDNKGGYFKQQYEELGKSLTGNSGIFKSTSGWNDGKYYALVNNVAVGTIVKVNNPANGKSVYAKVLGSLPDMKESIGLSARISDAAAAELGLTGIKFSVDMKY